ncbi:AsmA family protein [Nonlabens xiamenensis]|uniref:hypothetical protein n=1 Tax=Nonlabens xiamenensis TaxID=2341043 RepID=UPI000F604907|nr:hypothetical protein [Nonlabens xiamenensis]
MTKKIWIILGIIALVFISGYIAAEIILKNKIQNFIHQGMGSTVNAQYADLEVSLWNGSAKLDSLYVSITNKADTVTHTNMTASKLSLKDLSYWDYLFHNEIHISSIILSAPHIKYYKHKRHPADTTTHTDPVPLQQLTFKLDQFEIDDARIEIRDGKGKTPLLKSGRSSLHLTDIKITPESVQQKIPLTYQEIELNVDSLSVRTSDYDHLNTGEITASGSTITVMDLHLLPDYSKSKLSQVLNRERDHTTLKIPQTTIDEYEVSFKNDQLYITAEKLEISQPDLDIYRDKQVADDNRVKPLYSEMLRELPFSLAIDSVQITKASITYEEKAKEDQPAGTIDFTSLDMQIDHLGNRQEKGTRTTLHAEGLFLQSSPLVVDWSFDVQDQTDQFNFAASLSQLPAENINDFSVPNLKTAFEGSLQKIYFDIDGNNHTSNVKMKMKYDDFKVKILQSNDFKVNDLLSGIANLFVNKDSKDKGQEFINGKATAERNKTKSFFNYIWINIKNGLVDTML